MPKSLFVFQASLTSLRDVSLSTQQSLIWLIEGGRNGCGWSLSATTLPFLKERETQPSFLSLKYTCSPSTHTNSRAFKNSRSTPVVGRVCWIRRAWFLILFWIEWMRSLLKQRNLELDGLEPPQSICRHNGPQAFVPCFNAFDCHSKVFEIIFLICLRCPPPCLVNQPTTH